MKDPIKKGMGVALESFITQSTRKKAIILDKKIEYLERAEKALERFDKKNEEYKQ